MTTLANSISGPGSRASSSVAESDDLGADSSLKERLASQSDLKQPFRKNTLSVKTLKGTQAMVKGPRDKMSYPQFSLV